MTKTWCIASASVSYGLDFRSIPVLVPCNLGATTKHKIAIRSVWHCAVHVDNNIHNCFDWIAADCTLEILVWSIKCVHFATWMRMPLASSSVWKVSKRSDLWQYPNKWTVFDKCDVVTFKRTKRTSDQSTIFDRSIHHKYAAHYQFAFKCKCSSACCFINKTSL